MEWNAKQLKNSKENETWNFVWYFCTLTYLQNKFFSLAHTSNLHPFIPSLVSCSVCTFILHRVCVIMKICVCVCVCVWYIIPFYQLAIKNVLILLHVNVSSSRTKLLFLGVDVIWYRKLGQTKMSIIYNGFEICYCVIDLKYILFANSA